MKIPSGPRFRVGDIVLVNSQYGLNPEGPFEIERVSSNGFRNEYTLSGCGVMWNSGRKVAEEDLIAWPGEGYQTYDFSGLNCSLKT